MERRPRIFPKELVHFPRKGLQNKMPSVLLPCPPHRISPLWEQSCKSRAEQVPHLSHQARVTEISSASTFFRNTEKESSTQVLRRLAISSHLSHNDHKTMTVLLPCLHHRGLAKPSPRHKHRALASLMPFPRSNFRAKKTALKLTADEQWLMPPAGHKNQPSCLLDLDHQSLDHSGPDHLPKIFPGYKNRAEAVTHLDEKVSSPPTPVQKIEVPLCEGDKTKPGPICRPNQDAQTGATPGPLTSSTQQTKASLRHRRNQVRTATMLLGFTKKGDRPTTSTSSHCLKDWSRAKALEPPDLAKVLKKSHSDLCPRNMVSLIGCANPESRSLTPSSTHHDQKTTVTTEASPDHQAEDIQASTAQVTPPVEVESCKEATPQRKDDQATAVADQYHEATPLLNQDSPEHWSTPASVSEAQDSPDTNIHSTLQAEQDHQEKMTYEIEHHALIPADKHQETTHPPLVPQDTSPDQWVKVTPSLPYQTEATQCFYTHVSVQTDQSPITHASVQTEQEIWQTVSSTDHQVTTLIGSDHGTTPPLGLNLKLTLSGLNHHPTPTQSPDHQMTGNRVDINPPVTPQAGQDHVGEVEQEIELDQDTIFTGQDYRPLNLDSQDKIPPGSDYQAVTRTGQDPGIIPPLALGPQKTIPSKPGQPATSLINPHHLAKQTQNHLACVSVQKEHEPQEIITKLDEQAIALIGQDHGSESLLDLDSKGTLQPGLDHWTTSPSSPDHQAEDLSVLDIQLMFQRESDPWEKTTLETHHCTTLLTHQGLGAATPPFNLDLKNEFLPASELWVASPSGEDHEITLPLALGPQDKTLPEPDQWSVVLTSPPHQNQAFQDQILEISVQTNQECWQKRPPRTDQEATTPTGQDHGGMPPLVLDIKDTLSPGPDRQATSPPSSDSQVENMPGPNVQFTVEGEQESWEEITRQTHQETVMLANQSPPWNLVFQDKTSSASDPQTTTLRGQDHETTLPLTFRPQNKSLFEFDQQIKNTQSHIAKVVTLTEQKPWETMPPRTDHQAVALTDQDLGVILPMHLDAPEKSIPGSDQQASTLTGQNYETTPSLDLGPQDKIQNCIRPLPHPCHLAGDTQGQTPQASLQTDQEPQETITAGTNNQTTILKGQDYANIPPRAFGPQNKTLWETDQQPSTPPPPFYLQAKDAPNHIDEILIQTEQEKTQQKIMPPRTDHQATALVVQDYGTTSPMGLDPKDMKPTGFYWATYRHSPNQEDKMFIDHNAHVTLQPDLNHWETISQEKDLSLINLTVEDFSDSPPSLGLDNEETTQAGLDQWDICPPNPSFQVEDRQYPKVTVSPQSEDYHWKTIPQGIPKNITLTGQAIPLLALGLQDQILPLPDHQAIPQTNPQHSAEDTPDSLICVCPQKVQEPLDAPPTGKGQWATTPTDQAPGLTLPLGLEKDKIQSGLYHLPCLPGSDYHSEDTPASNVHASTQTEQDHRQMIPKRKDPQAKAQTNPDHQEARPLVDLDQNEFLTGPRLQTISSPSPYEQAEHIQSPVAHISFPTDPEPWETIPPKMDNQNTTLKAQNNKAILTVSLESQNATLPDSNYQDTNVITPDQQAGDIQRPTAHDVLLETEQEYWETMPPRIDYHQDTILEGQDNGRAIPLLSLDTQDKTLFGPNLQDISKFIPDKQMESTQSSSAHVSPQTKAKFRETIPPRIAHQATSGKGQVNGSASLLSSVPCDLNQSGSAHYQAVIPLANPNHKPEVAVDLQTRATVPSNNHALPKLSLDLNHKVTPKSITNLKPRQSEQNPWCFKYIEPCTVNGTTIPTEIMQTIISSIPQERIKSDISKQILLRRMKVSSALQGGHQIFSSYPVCLICASWIPDNCPHVQKMKYPCEAQLLAIPTPLPSHKEDMAVKFVLQAPQTKRFTFILPEMRYISQRPTHHSAHSSPSSYAESVRTSLLLKRRTQVPSPVPERIKGLSFLFDRYHQPGGRATFRSQQSPTGTKSMKKYNSREDELRKHPMFFRSLLERFQLRQKVN